MKILITGGNGFLGNHISEVLDEETHHAFQYARVSRINGVDLRDLNFLKAYLSTYKPDVIIHCAADVGNLDYIHKNAADVIYNNVLMYLNLYKALSDLKLDTVVINTIANCSYPGALDIQNENQWWDGPIHDSVLAYGGAKKSGYLISKCNEEQYGIKTINLIMPNAYGPYDHLNEERTHAMNGLVLRMIKDHRCQQKTFSVWGTGTPIREWVYMRDVAMVIRNILHRMIEGLTNTVPSLVNIGQQRGVSIKDTAEMIKAALGAKFEIVYDTTKKDGAPIKVLGNGEFKKHFPYFEFTPYEQGIQRTINWYKKMI